MFFTYILCLFRKKLYLLAVCLFIVHDVYLGVHCTVPYVYFGVQCTVYYVHLGVKYTVNDVF